MNDLLFWLYLVNATLIIAHEIDSAFYREWELFHLPGGSGGFVAIHIPVVALVLYGLAAVQQLHTAGLVLSLVLSAGGIFAFGIHTWFIRKGRTEFKGLVSQVILWATLVVSLAQAGAVLHTLSSTW